MAPGPDGSGGSDQHLSFFRDDVPDLDAAIAEMLDYDGPVVFDCIVDKKENCFPMIPSGKAHNEMLLSDYLGETGVELGDVISEEGKMLV